MKFRFGLIIYNCILLTAIVIVCILEWNSLSRFQTEYEAKKQAEQKKREEEAIAKAHEKKDKTIIADGFMKIYLNDEVITCEPKTKKSDIVCNDLTELTGIEANKCTYTIQVASADTLVVKDAFGNELTPVNNNNYAAAAYAYDEALAKEALEKFEYYLYFMNGMASLNDMQKITTTDSKAYKTLLNSKEMLYWSKKSSKLTFDEEEITNMRQYDDTHFICDIHTKMTKTLRNGRTEQEEVHYRILFEKIEEKWYIYSYANI